jgi:hypothetical protein
MATRPADGQFRPGAGRGLDTPGRRAILRSDGLGHERDLVPSVANQPWSGRTGRNLSYNRLPQRRL